ncbi:MAG: hypothetical protein Q8Q23_06070 [bacterium]|nr:hypothetical protein [bacterium]
MITTDSLLNHLKREFKLSEDDALIKKEEVDEYKENFILIFRKEVNKDRVRGCIIQFYKKNGYTIPSNTEEFDEFYDLVFVKSIETLCVNITMCEHKLTTVLVTVINNNAGLFFDK